MTLDPVIAVAVAKAEDYTSMSRGISLMSERGADFSSADEMKLAGIGVIPAARDMVNAELTRSWDQDTRQLRAFTNTRSEVIIGSGLHAAVYCASRVMAGFPKPVVLERYGGQRAGGIFATSLQPAWWLNSTNKPGIAGFPGSPDALNNIPGALVQPSMLARGRFPSNADLAFAIRLMLRQYAIVFSYTEVTGYDAETFTVGGGSYLFGRLLDMRGLGDPVLSGSVTGNNVITFQEFMGRMGSKPFPLRGLRKVAVIGGGDSGKCAVEALIGLSPPSHLSVTGLDYVQKVDWYAERLPQTVGNWRATQKGRYIQIGSCLPRDRSVPSRLTIIPDRASAVPSGSTALVNGNTYDLAVVCAGFGLPDIASPERTAENAFLLGGITTALKRFPEVYLAGAAMDLPFSVREDDYAQVAENRAAIFRLAPRTAALAANLPDLN